MPTQVTLAEVLRSPEDDWSNDFGSFHVYTLSAPELPSPVKVNRKPDSPTLSPGQQVWLETQAGRGGVLKGKIVQAPEGAPAPRQNGQGALTREDPTRHSIEAQVAIKAAVEYARGFDQMPGADLVGETAKTFFRAMQEMQA